MLLPHTLQRYFSQPWKTDSNQAVSCGYNGILAFSVVHRSVLLNATQFNLGLKKKKKRGVNKTKAALYIYKCFAHFLVLSRHKVFVRETALLSAQKRGQNVLTFWLLLWVRKMCTYPLLQLHKAETSPLWVLSAATQPFALSKEALVGVLLHAVHSQAAVVLALRPQRWWLTF